MPRYIDADALRERVLYRKKPRNHMDDEAGAYDRGFNAGIFAASKEIDSAPTVSPDEVRGVGMWISVEERLPEKRQMVLVAYDNGVVAKGKLFFGKFRGAYFGFDENDEPIVAEVTHWMPLPEPPKEG